MILNSATFSWKRNNGLPKKSFLDYVLYMVICFTCLSVYVPYVPTCFCILRVYIPMLFVFYVATCVGLCVFILFLPFARCLRHTSGVRINDVMLSLSFQVLLPNSFIPISKYVIFHLQRQNSSSLTNGEKTI